MFQAIFTAQRLYNGHNNIKSALPEVTGSHILERHTHISLSVKYNVQHKHIQHCFQMKDIKIGLGCLLFSQSVIPLGK